jgi:hypothetical protein
MTSGIQDSERFTDKIKTTSYENRLLIEGAVVRSFTHHIIDSLLQTFEFRNWLAK